MALEMKVLMETMPQVGRVCWIGIRPERKSPLSSVESVAADESQGLVGDHFSGGANAKRQVTLIQKEHIDSVAAIMQKSEVDPGLLRRNIVVEGINLQALKDRQFSIGSVVFFATGNCPPCSRMEENLGAGGYNAMRGHGGITAYVVSGGKIQVGDTVSLNIDR